MQNDTPAIMADNLPVGKIENWKWDLENYIATIEHFMAYLSNVKDGFNRNEMKGN